MILPIRFLKGATQLIETGTGPGGGVRRALKTGVPVIHSIELNKALYCSACEQFAGEPRVQLHFGSSPDVLREIVTPLAGTVFWLDAHYSGGLWSATIDERFGQCPLLAELAVIRALCWAEPPLILVDDADHFNPAWDGFQGAYDRKQWPVVDEIRAAVQPWPVWLYGIDSQNEEDDTQLIIGRGTEILNWGE